jgi:pantetheine-phosphate adenylyltransferase
LTIAIYPGSFDPITNGHIDIATRASKLFDKIIIAVFDTPSKKLVFTTAERVDLVTKAVANMSNVEVVAFKGLTIHFARQVNAKVMVRGLRMSADFEREFEMAMMNKKLDPDLELICFMANQDYQFLSSSLLKEVAGLQGNINDLVPEFVVKAIKRKVLTEM